MPLRQTTAEWLESEADTLTAPYEALLSALIQAADRLGMTDAEADQHERAIARRSLRSGRA